MPPEQQGQFQYRQLPDGKWGKYNANATEEEISADMQAYSSQGKQQQGSSDSLSLPNQISNAPAAFNTGATGSPDIPSFASRAWEGIKSNAKQFMDEGPISYATDKIQGAYDAQYGPQGAVSQYPTSDPRRFEAAIPGVGPALADMSTTALEKGPVVGAAQGIGSAIGGAIGAKAIGGAAGKVANIPADMEASRLNKAQNLYERTVAPSSIGVDDQAAMRTAYQRGAPYLADEARIGPTPGGSLGGSNEGGVYRVANRIRNAKLQMWDENVTPFINRFGTAVDETVPEISNSIRGDLTDLNKTKPGAEPATERLASVFDQPMSIKQMYDTVTELNNDRAVSRYHEMTDQEKFAAETNDPALRHKVNALDMLRDKLVNKIGEVGGDAAGQQFAEFRRGYGGLADMESRMRGTTVPTPIPLTTRAANTVRLSLIPGRGLSEYANKPVNTLFNLNNPNRMAAKSFNLLGKTDIGSPPPPQFQPNSPNPIGPVGPSAAPVQGPQPQPPTPAQPVEGPPQLGFNVNVPPETISQMWGRETPGVGLEQRPIPSMWGDRQMVPSNAVEQGGMNVQNPSPTRTYESLNLPSEQPMVKSPKRETADEEARRGAGGVPPARKSLRRNIEKNRKRAEQ